MTIVQRAVRRVVTLPAATPGFLGAGHTAIEILDMHDLTGSDPFVLLMDDRIDFGAVPRKVGEAHPHAGLETVTLFLEGTMADRDEGDTVAGDAQWMTAGRGIIHSENIVAAGKARILQLWIRLPATARQTDPAVQLLQLETLPIRREPGVEARLYSGTSGSLKSPTRNHAPITMLDVHLAPQTTFDQDLPSSYNGFAYVLEGEVTIGGTKTKAGQVAWLDRPNTDGASNLRMATEGQNARLVLYTGQPQNEPLLHYGPFVAGSEPDLRRLFASYRAGEFQRLSALTPTI